MQKSSQGWWDFPANVLLALAVLVTATRLSLTKWTPNLTLVTISTILGLALGIALAKSSFQRAGIFSLTLLYSITMIPWQIISIEASSLPVLMRLENVSARIKLSYQTLSKGLPVDDHIFFVALMILLFWLMALYATYSIIRHKNIIAALALPTFVILIIQYYDQTQEATFWNIGVYFLLVLALLTRLNYLEHQKLWRGKNFFIDSGIGFDITIASFLAMTIVLLIAWNLPTHRSDWSILSAWWQEATTFFDETEDQLSNALASIEEKPISDSGDLYQSRLAVGERPYQKNNVLFTVHIVDGPSAQRYYWKLRVYDSYQNGYWSPSQKTPNLYIPAMETINQSSTSTQEFLVTSKIQSQSLLLGVQEPVWVSVNTRISHIALPDGKRDVNRLVASSILGMDESYTLNANMISPSIVELQEAGIEYPDLISEYYLQLPEDFPNKIRKLALEITDKHETPYEKTSAVINYLRSQIGYNDRIAAPPRGEDPIEWFLFTKREGFCNYAASAAVVMLRAIDIPARLAVGFAEGERDAEGNYLVLQSNAHVWPEVYFPDIGWVEFEPTLNQALLLRPAGEFTRQAEFNDMLSGRVLNKQGQGKDTQNLLDEKEDLLAPEILGNAPKRTLQIPAFWGIIIAITVAAFFGLWQLNRKQFFLTSGLRFAIQFYERNSIRTPKWLIRWENWYTSGAISRAFFYGINGSLRWLGAEVPLHFTPRERADALEKFLPEEVENIQILLIEHERALFTPVEGNVQIAQRASLAIRWRTIKRRIQML